MLFRAFRGIIALATDLRLQYKDFPVQMAGEN